MNLCGEISYSIDDLVTSNAQYRVDLSVPSVEFVMHAVRESSSSREFVDIPPLDLMADVRLLSHEPKKT